jgi:RNA polymerase sigma factor (sigma-70 family)
MDRETELSLVCRLRQGDAKAFDEVHAEFNRRLFNFLARLSRSRDVAEDLLEETWLRLVTHSRRLEPDTQLARWLFTVSRNLYVSYCRSRLLEDSAAAGLLGLWPVAPREPSPFDQTAATELERRIESAIAGLPPRFREALLLVGVEGLQPSEAAAICGLKPEAMRQRVKRARAMLEKALGDAHDGRSAQSILAAAAAIRSRL